MLDLRSYLLGDVPLDEVDEEQIVRPGNHATNQPYKNARLFGVKIALLLVMTAVSLVFGGLFVLTVPVITGRNIIGFWMGDVKVHELNTAACGLYVGLLVTRLTTLLCRVRTRCALTRT